MALFLGTWNVPTNKKLRVNTTDVTEVYSNGVLVWKYVKPTGGGGGHWVARGPAFQNGDDVTGATGLDGVGTVFCSPNADGVSWTCQVRVWVPDDDGTYEPDEVDIDIDDIINKDEIQDEG